LKSNSEIKETVIYVANLNSDVSDELDDVSIFNLSEEERIEKLTMLSETSQHCKSILLTFLWLYGKISDEELLMNEAPVNTF